MVRPQKYVSLEGQEDFLKKYLHLKLLKADIKEPHSVIGVICVHIFKMNNVKLRRSIYKKIISLKKVSPEMEPQPTTNETLVEGMFDMGSTEMNTEMENPKKVSSEMEPQPTTNETLVEGMFDMGSTEMNTEMGNPKKVSSEMEPQPTTNETLVESMFDMGRTEMNPEMKNPKMADTPPKIQNILMKVR
ncbi:hypothetical protein DPMN_160293 [Dreissena polymorpha]|uniref:Uncharacterized protein n=1 Tax=Dreissena polymorpha TaxID=45954 RepID=A0A9D4EMI2_DREPO|nr:hypothetical protein DPMN_160293 [Dreissena polymorpha]